MSNTDLIAVRDLEVCLRAASQTIGPRYRLAFRSVSVTIRVIGSSGDGSKPVRS